MSSLPRLGDATPIGRATFCSPAPQNKRIKPEADKKAAGIYLMCCQENEMFDIIIICVTVTFAFMVK